MKRIDDKPYCKECGYLLVGLTHSAKCPECGRPIVDVLVRDSFPGRAGYRYESETRLFGLPLISIASGPHGPEVFGKPVGIIAIGDAPRGVIAIGGRAIGGIAIGGLAVGGISFGGLGVGIIGLGGCGAGILGLGGMACGLWAIGGMALAVIQGWGGRVIYLWPW
ncbi:MAG TPA: hypothetical protein PKY77_07045 [Phycisphaerae bacterium]|nr:hypothetical protein [Phycisphaerae bacterium]HRY69573.1 hypothetical protein [Phycisphaerae bacterium]HSA29724.1 hypothetical protein [Phycisphaerae bacterium]